MINRQIRIRLIHTNAAKGAINIKKFAVLILDIGYVFFNQYSRKHLMNLQLHEAHNLPSRNLPLPLDYQGSETSD